MCVYYTVCIVHCIILVKYTRNYVVSLFYSVRVSASNEEAGFGTTDVVNATTGTCTTDYNVCLC